jgi:hypothetical protein
MNTNLKGQARANHIIDSADQMTTERYEGAEAFAKWPAMCGQLQAHIGVLCAELADLERETSTPAAAVGAKRIAAVISGGGGTDVSVLVDYAAYVIAGNEQYGDSAGVEIVHVWAGPVDIAAILSPSQIGGLEDDCLADEVAA